MWHVLKSFQKTQIQCIYGTLECQCVNRNVQDQDKIYGWLKSSAAANYVYGQQRIFYMDVLFG